jgi:hypothetical protein
MHEPGRSPRAAHSPRIPSDPVGWGVFAWAVGGVVMMLLEAVVRLGLVAVDGLGHGLTPAQALFAAAWVGFMVYAEAWRGFHLRFAPRVVARAVAIAADRRPFLVLLAPLAAMGLLWATPRRVRATWALVIGIVALILVVRALPEPWRAIVDLGVVLGLTGGTLSLGVHTVRAVRGRPTPMDPDLPGA